VEILIFLGHFIIFLSGFYTFNFVRREKKYKRSKETRKKTCSFFISIDSITPLTDSQVVLHIIDSSFAQ